MVKVISLSDYAYTLLKSYKRTGMSFSDVILSELSGKQVEKTETLDDLFDWAEKLPKGKWKMSAKEDDEAAYGVKR